MCCLSLHFPQPELCGKARYRAGRQHCVPAPGLCSVWLRAARWNIGLSWCWPPSQHSRRPASVVLRWLNSCNFQIILLAPGAAAIPPMTQLPTFRLIIRCRMSFGEIGSSVYFEHPLKPWNVSNLSDCLLVVCTANFLYSFMSFPHHLARHSGQNSSDHTTQQSNNLHSEQQREDTCDTSPVQVVVLACGSHLYRK